MKDTLRNVSDRVLPFAEIRFVERSAVDGDAARRGAVEAQQDVEQRRLSHARRTPYADALALADRERQIVQYVAVGCVVEVERKPFDSDFPLEWHPFLCRVDPCGRIVEPCVAQHVDRVTVVTQRRPRPHDAAHRGHDAQCSDGEDAEQQFHLRVVRSGAERHEDGHADGQSHFGEHRGKRGDRGVALPHADDFIHRAVEVAQHRGIGARDFQVGIAAEGLDHGARLAPLRTVLLLAVAVQALPYQVVVERYGRYEDREAVSSATSGL